MVDFYFHDPSWDQEFRSKNASVTLLDCTSWGPKVREDLVVITTFEAFEASQLLFFFFNDATPLADFFFGSTSGAGFFLQKLGWWGEKSSFFCGKRGVLKSVVLLMAEILHQLIGSLSNYLQGFIHPRWCRISSINISFMVQ